MEPMPLRVTWYTGTISPPQGNAREIDISYHLHVLAAFCSEPCNWTSARTESLDGRFQQRVHILEAFVQGTMYVGMYISFGTYLTMQILETVNSGSKKEDMKPRPYLEANK